MLHLTASAYVGLCLCSLLAGGYWGFHRGKPVPFANRESSWIFEVRTPGYERASAKIEGGGGDRERNSLCQLSTRPRPGRANSRWRPHYEFRFFSTIQPPACRLMLMLMSKCEPAHRKKNLLFLPCNMAATIKYFYRGYRLISVASWKFDVLKTNICPRSEASRENMLVLRTSNFQGATIMQTDSSKTQTRLSLLFTTKFDSAL